MRKATLILLVSIILFQSTGVFVLFKLKQAEIRQEVQKRIKAGLTESELVTLTFSYNPDDDNIAGIKWIKNHEFVFEGQLYDVVKQKIECGNITFFCFRDFEENTLLKNLNKLVGNVLGADKATNKTTTVSGFNWFFQSHAKACFTLFTKFHLLNTSYLFTSKFWDSPPGFPPPKS